MFFFNDCKEKCKVISVDKCKYTFDGVTLKKVDVCFEDDEKTQEFEGNEVDKSKWVEEM